MQIAAGNEGRCRFRFNRAETFFLHHRDSGFEGVTLVNLTRGSSDLKSFTASANFKRGSRPFERTKF